jgi:hypothetical protein
MLSKMHHFKRGRRVEVALKSASSDAVTACIHHTRSWNYVDSINFSGQLRVAKIGAISAL